MVMADSGPAIDAMLMMRPALRSKKYDATALHVRKTDFVLTAKARSQSSSVLFVNGMPGGDAMPALFTRMSMRPSTSRVRSTISFTSALLVTSHFMASTRRPSAFTSSAVFSALSTWMSGIAMSAPSFAIASTMPRPMPRPPPVTIATFPSSRAMHSSVDIIGASEGHMTTHHLRSRNWFGRMDLDGFAHRSWLKTEGFSDQVFDGHCMVMGTASTMASMAEALGMTLPGNAAIPAPDSRRLAHAELAGRRAVEMATAGGPQPPGILPPPAVANPNRAFFG